MDQEQKRRQSFLLRLPLSVREEATRIAQMEGTSLNHFIALALAEKISRMEASRAQAASTPVPPVRLFPYATPFKLHRSAQVSRQMQASPPAVISMSCKE